MACLKVWDGSEWVTVGGPGDFTDHSDTPSTYSGQAGKVLRVNAGETAVEFNNIWIDNNAILLGTGSDSSLKYDGTNTIWDLQATGTGHLHISKGSVGIGVVPEFSLHIFESNSGGTAAANTALWIETSGTAYISMTGGTAGRVGFLLGDLTSRTEQQIISDMGTRSLEFHTADVKALTISSAGNVDVEVGNLTLVDSSTLSLGTSEDSTLTYDGTNTVWDLRAATTGTGLLHVTNGNIGIGIVPEAILHTFRGSSGATVPANTGFWTEHSGINHIAITGGATSQVGILMGDNNDAAEQRVISDNNARSLDFWTAGVERMSIDSSGDTLFSGAVSLLDSELLRFGTGLDSTIKYDGTNTIWRVNAIGSGFLHIDRGGSLPAIDTETVLVVGADNAFGGSSILTIIADNASTINFGDASDDNAGTIAYDNGAAAFFFTAGTTLMGSLTGSQWIFGNTSGTGRVAIDQSSSTGAVTVLGLDQADIDDTFIDFIGTSAADGSRSISSDTTEDGAKFGAFKVEINGVTKWIRVYDDHS